MKRAWTAVLAALGMAVLILDTKTALYGARIGMDVCIKTVVPSLFPFLVLSALLNSALLGRRMRLLQPIAALLQVPKQAMGLIVVGLLGGYPVGAQVVGQAHRDGYLSGSDAKRMAAFCSNAGPAFLFGIGAGLFPKLWICFLIWAIHIVSSWCVALLTPCDTTQSAQNCTTRVITLPQAVTKSVATMATICGWVVLFRVLVAFCDRWFLWAVGSTARAVIIGVMELANGCCALEEIPSLGLRLTLFAMLLSFGGLCVTMQTVSMLQGGSMALYLPGKCCQAAVSFLLCIPAQLLLPHAQRFLPGITQIVVCCTVCVLYRFFTRKMQKSSSIPVEVTV